MNIEIEISAQSILRVARESILRESIAIIDANHNAIIDALIDIDACKCANQSCNDFAMMRSNMIDDVNDKIKSSMMRNTL